jgi:integrase
MRQGYPRRYRTFDSRTEALTWAREVESAMDRGRPVASGEEERVTLAEALEHYVREVTIHKRGAKQEAQRAARLKKSPLGRLYLASLGGQALAKHRDRLLSEGKAANTIRLDFALISHLFTTAITEWGMATLTNPVELVRKPKPSAGRDRRLLLGEEERVLQAATRYREFPELIRFALETAMRRGELANMRWDKVNLAKRTVLVKTKDAKVVRSRTVPLSTTAVKILEFLPRQIDGRVWTLSPAFITTGFRRIVVAARADYLEQCGQVGKEPDPAYLTNLRFHDLRHEATSRFFECGLNPMQVAAITGHKTLQMLKRYTHLKAEDLARLLG